jgi:hypothetical protein
VRRTLSERSIVLVRTDAVSGASAARSALRGVEAAGVSTETRQPDAFSR